MAEIKIQLQKGETPEQVEDLLFKAFEQQRNGETHGEEYSDPAMRDVMNLMENEFKKQQDLMMQEIFEELEKEYQDNGNF